MKEGPIRVVVIGGDAAGMSAASQIKRRMKSAEVVVLEKSKYVSYGACSMPYNIGYGGNVDDLVVMSAQEFREKRGIDVRLFEEAISVDVNSKTVRVKNHASNREYEISYDYLVITTGARAKLPDIDGVYNEGVFTLKTLDDAKAIKSFLHKNKPKSCVFIGAGYINLELADNLKRAGIEEITMLKRSDVLMNEYEEEVDEAVRSVLDKNGVKLVTGIKVEGIDGTTVKTNKGDFKSDMVQIGIGFVPNTEFLSGSGIELDEKTKAISVDRYLRTNVQDVYSAGDCAMLYHKVLDKYIYLPSGNNANKTGKLAGANIAGANEQFSGTVGTRAFETFGLGIGKTGLSLKEAQDKGFDAFKTVITAPTKAHGYPFQSKITVILIADKKTGKLLGSQMFGDVPSVLRINVLATALHADMTIKDIQGLDLVYSPPFAPVWDPILVCANQAIKQVGK